MLRVLADAHGAAADWTPVLLASGMRGHVASRWIRSPIDYRIGIAVDECGDGWIRYSVAGD